MKQRVERFEAGETYRNDHMRDVDFHVLGVEVTTFGVRLHGIWVNRRGGFLHGNDSIGVTGEMLKDWSKVGHEEKEAELLGV